MMAARQVQRPGDRLSELEGKLSDESRYLDLCLEIRRKRTGETLLTVGGQWDRLTETFTDDEPTTCKVIWVKESQVGVVKKFAEWLRRFMIGEPRERILLTGGKRRGGKSWITVACIAALAIAVPDALCWMVSPTLGKRDELERYFKEIVPAEWRSYRGMPDFRFTLPNGSTIQSLTGDTADALKRGEATAILYNEPQDCAVDVATYGLPALIDEGGLALFAGNPARKRKGEWFNGLRQFVLEDTRPDPRIGAFFDVPSELNDSIDQAARADFGDLLRVLDPRAAAADDEGLWLPVGDRAYMYFDKKRNTGETPQLGDVTAEVTARKVRRGYGRFAGADFQGRPWNAGVVLQAFGDAKKPIYYAVGEILKEGYEDDFLDEVYIAGFEPEQLVWIGDASGTWQDAHHTRGRVSFDIFKARRWHIEPPQKKKSDRGEHPRNPDIEDRVNLVNKLLATGRLIVDSERCPKLIEALAECEMSKDGKPRGKHAHITDALGYALWWAEPQPKAAPRGGDKKTAYTFDLTRRGADYI